MSDLKTIFSLSGPFARTIPGYQPRSQQIQMAEKVDEAIQKRSLLMIEAGTGVGKTFAYLVPSLLSGKKTIISTGTKTLQDQLFERDAAMVCKTLGIPARIALLKGRSNYLCLYRLDRSLHAFRGSQTQLRKMMQLQKWADQTEDGDLSGVSLLGEKSVLWNKVTSNSENCLGQDCPAWESCFLVKARRRAQKADLVIVNHHLLFADFVLRNDGLGEVLPDADVFVLDEAHQLPETGSQFLGEIITTRQIRELCEDIEDELQSLKLQDTDLANFLHGLISRSDMVRDLEQVPEGTGPAKKLLNDVHAKPLLDELTEGLESLEKRVEQFRDASATMKRFHERCVETLRRLERFTGQEADGYVRWYEKRSRTLLLKMTPLNIGEHFQAFIQKQSSTWILTSATLTVSDSFDFIIQRLGMPAAVETCILGSPFNYRKQSLLYLPDSFPDPRHPGFYATLAEEARRLIEICRGRTFLLFTSFRALNEMESRLEGSVSYPLLVQGRASRSQILRAFRETDHAVLLGTLSFWEGVDVKGDSLSCVIIDKLPFTSPDDPVLEARLDHLKKSGKNPFMLYQVPSAAILLKQGVGRLIRDRKDRGIVMIADNRLSKARYGKVFLDTLPDMKVVHDMEVIRSFF